MMSMPLRSAVVYTGEPFYAGNIPDAQRAVEAACTEKGGFVAPAHLLLENWPHPELLTCATEDLSGIVNTAVPRLGVKNGECVVATYHGGVGGAWGLLAPDKVARALELRGKNEGGLNAVYAAVLSQLYDKDVLTPLVAEGALPGGRQVQVFSYEQLLEGTAQEHNANCTPYVVVRSLDLARKTVSGHEAVDLLTDREGNVTDSQVITYAGSKANAQGVIQRAKQRGWTKLGVWHPFNNEKFNPNETQGRLAFLGYNGNLGLVGDFDLDSFGGRFVRVGAAEPLGVVRGAPHENGQGHYRASSLDETVIAALRDRRAFTHNGVVYTPNTSTAGIKTE